MQAEAGQRGQGLGGRLPGHRHVDEGDGVGRAPQVEEVTQDFEPGQQVAGRALADGYDALARLEGKPVHLRRESGIGEQVRRGVARLRAVRFAVVALIDNLERKGLVERRRNPQDRRNYALHLTEQGTHVMTQMRRLGKAHEDDICAALDHAQRAQLTELLEAIAAQQKLTPGVHPGYR
ncbi:MarR family winged helix-turn-helix transcriptional regulator [Microbispora sp. CA-102843]|uniref:MarR family winged helix-turn-helix transcriptional regulator n=1 Tax=Microbispora sp. CA-102843 TaxID=3239952 RepID=UPI003D8A881C